MESQSKKSEIPEWHGVVAIPTFQRNKMSWITRYAYICMWMCVLYLDARHTFASKCIVKMLIIGGLIRGLVAYIKLLRVSTPNTFHSPPITPQQSHSFNNY